MMKRIITLPIVLVVAPLLIVIAAPQTDPNVREIGSRLELFVDNWLIDTWKGVELRLHRPVLGNRVLEIDQPWEKTWEEMLETQRQAEIAQGVWNGPTPFGFSTVMKDGDLFRMYYTWDRWNRDSLSAYAESRDGIHWTKPGLGIVEFRGSKANNLFWSEEGIHNFNPFLDRNPAAGPEARYKALGGGHQEGPRGLIAFVSADALHWKKLRDKPVITDGAFDSQNVAFWDMEQRQYVAFYRDFVSSPNQKQKVRAIKRATSSDFINWSKGEWLNYGDAPLEQFYTNAITPYFRAPHLYIGFPMRIVFDRKKVAEHPYDGVSDAVFISSRDGTKWDRQFLEGFVNPGLEHQNWTERNFLVTWGVVPTGPYEMSMYWSSTSGIRASRSAAERFASMDLLLCTPAMRVGK